MALSQEQEENRAAIGKSAMVLGAIVGLTVGLLALWLLGSQSGAIRYGGTVVIAGVVGYLVHRASFKSGAKAALCAKCGAAFSRSRTDRAETVIDSSEKEEREEQPDKSVKVTTWIEDKVDVVDTFTCAKCGDVTTNAYQTTRRRDESSLVEPYEAPQKASAKGGKGAAATGKADAGKGGRKRASRQ